MLICARSSFRLASRLFNEVQQGHGAQADETIKVVATKLRHGNGMPAAYALLVDQLRQTHTLAIPYRAAGVLDMGKTLMQLSTEAPGGPEHDRALIDAWGKALGMASWYTWRPYKMLA